MAEKHGRNKNNGRTPRSTGLRWWWVLVLTPFIGLALMLAIAATSDDLPSTTELQNPRSDLATAVLFSDGSLMGQYYRENRIPVDYDRISPNVVNALIATEDERFREHSGIDVRSTLRALVFLGKKGGASTITQQLAKMLFHEPARGFFSRVRQKSQEWLISAKLEREYTKDEIIAMYLNRFDWINQAVGINSAARIYFNTTPDSLAVHQAALLVGMCKNPALFNPLRRPDTTLTRRNVVLYQMEKNGFITGAQRDSLKALPLSLDFQRVDHTEGPAPYLREVLREELKSLLAAKDPKTGALRIAKADGTPYDIYTDGLRIYTTIDPRMQRYAEFAVREHLGTELQPQFFKDIKDKKNRPFDFRVTKEEVASIMDAAMKRSDRYKTYTGKLCANCQRPAAYITTMVTDGKKYYHCDPAKGGCDTKWPVRSEKEIVAAFDQKEKMRVFSWKGEIDTLFSPNDSIRYYKSFLLSGLLSLDPATGFVKAWVGGPDFKHFQYDHVQQAHRQVGSTFKPFIYATAIREGMDPCLRVPNQKTCFDMPEGQPDWCPENSDAKYGGVLTLKRALANSVNTVTAYLMKQYSPQAVTVLARHMGVKSKLDPVPSLCLGVADLSLLEMTSAFATFANEGVHIEPIVFTRIEDKNGNTIYDATPVTTEALDPRTSFIMLDMLKGVADHGTAMRLRMGWGNRAKYGNIKYPTACKTGTTQNNSDGWFIGITPDLVTGVWTGAEDRSVRFSRTALGQGANMALPIYGYFMNKVYADPSITISTGDFVRPSELTGVDLSCGDRPSGTGTLAEPEEGGGGPVWE
ncbi:MAG TPA: transglycosylase domain-containing protein [Flavobacteriales bacterium]|nr:transglycosylase domain-containing protein [Flavobacteriales bacterium]